MLTAFLIGFAVLIVTFAIVWMIGCRVKNYGFVDATWSYGITLVAPVYAILGTGYLPRRLILTTIGVVWSLRLGTHILVRLLRHHPEEDHRYQSLRQEWKSPVQFLVFFEMQALTVAVLSLPFLLAAFDPRPYFTIVEILGYAVAVLALLGEALADHQIKIFASNPANKGKVCQTGLWRYSRHPNYFFEALVWWGFFLAALSSPWGWVTIICPLMMLWFLLKVTGIPLTEKHSVERKGQAYRDYQKTTSAFIPWFPKKNAS